MKRTTKAEVEQALERMGGWKLLNTTSRCPFVLFNTREEAKLFRAHFRGYEGFALTRTGSAVYLPVELFSTQEVL